MVRGWYGDAPIHLPSDSRHSPHLEPLEVRDSKPALLDQPIDASVEIAAATDDVLYWVETILPCRHSGIVAPTVFQKEERPFRLEDAMDLTEGFHGIVDRAERPGADDTVESTVGKRQRFSPDMLDMDGKRNGCGPLHYPLREEANGINDRETHDCARIVREVKAGPEADLQDVASGLSKPLRPQPLKLLAAHDPIHEARKDVVAVQSHRRAEV